MSPFVPHLWAAEEDLVAGGLCRVRSVVHLADADYGRGGAGQCMCLRGFTLAVRYLHGGILLWEI